MNFKFLILCALVFSFVGCKPGEKISGDEEAELARNSVGVEGATALWRCAGRLEEGSSEFMAATLQEDKYEHILSVSKVSVSGKKASQNTLLTQKVSITKLKTHENKETYHSTIPKMNFEFDVSDVVGSYDYKAQELLVPSVKTSTTGLPLQIDCKNVLVK